MTRPRRQVVSYTRAVTLAATAGRGWFITIEGPEGAGKTTQAAAPRGAPRRAGVPVLVTREPGGTSLGERIRDPARSDRRGRAHRPARPTRCSSTPRAASSSSEVIRPALVAGTTVICARFADSTLAYQGYGAGLPLDDLRALAAVATGGLRPDLTILLDLPVEVGLGARRPTT